MGSHQQTYSQYEVWDLQSEKRIFQIKNVQKGGVVISTNDGRTYGYSFKVEIDESGSFFLSDLTGEGVKFEMGEYVYEQELGRYKKK